MSTGTPSISEQKKALKAQLADLESKEIKKSFDLGDGTKLTVKIGDKGTVNFYGLGKNPVCLYFSQMVRLSKILNNPELKAFLAANNDKIAVRKVEEAK